MTMYERRLIKAETADLLAAADELVKLLAHASTSPDITTASITLAVLSADLREFCES